MSANSNLHRAKNSKNDEFFTRLIDIQKELKHYTKHFENKEIYCNCDNPDNSAFWDYFYSNFQELGLKGLIATYYGHPAYMTIYDGERIKREQLKGDGDFRSKECIKVMERSEVIVTNPPFSLFREFIGLLMEHNKKFLVIGSLNAFKYRECFPYIMNNQMWVGNNGVHNFIQPDGTIKKFGNVNWYTNLDFDKRHTWLVCERTYSSCDYPKYDTYDAIEVSRVADIPKDYNGIMGVPISFITSYNPEQFEIVGEFNHGSDNEFDLAKPVINGKELFPRIAIKFKR